MTIHRLVPILLAACTSTPNVVEVTLAPDVVSSLDATLAVHAVALHDRDTQANKPIAITIDYTDRNGVAHTIAEVDGTTDQRGEFDAVLTGLMWDGTGTVHAKTAAVEGDATFSVLDRTPPKVSIAAPATAHAGTTVDVQIMASDEIGVSQVIAQVNGGGGGGNNNFADRATLTNGATAANMNFNFDIPSGVAVGTVFTVTALAADMSANEGVAAPVTVTVN